MTARTACSHMINVIIVAAPLAWAAAPARAADQPVRCAILTPSDDRTGAAVADLLAIRLGQAAFAVVDRTHLAQTLGEQAMAQAFSASDPATRQRIGRLAGADLLVSLTCRIGDESTLAEWTVASMPEGIRIDAGGALWVEDEPDHTLNAILSSVQRAASLAKNSAMRYVCVPAFRCRDATFEHSGGQQALAKLAEQLLMQTPSVAVVALDEVHALTTESSLTGTIVTRRVPLLLAGEFETRRTDAGLFTTLDVELRAGSDVLGRRSMADLTDRETAPALRKVLGELLAEHAGLQVAATTGAEIEALRNQAIGLIRIGEWNDALPLIQTAVLLDPNDSETRRLLFWTWNGLVKSTHHLDYETNIGYRVQLMEYTLDAFVDMVRSRGANDEDPQWFRQFRAYGHLPWARWAERKYPNEFARYHAFNRRCRAVLRDIASGRYGLVNDMSRATAFEVMISGFGQDVRIAPMPVYREMVESIHELRAVSGADAHVFQILLLARSQATEDEPWVREFWSECCPPDDERMTVLVALANEVNAAREFGDAERFDASLARAVAQLGISDPVAREMRDLGHVKIERLVARATPADANQSGGMPELERISGIPKYLSEWIVGPAGTEFVRTHDAVYRVTPEGAFERVFAGKASRIAWDSRYLWVATPDIVRVLEPDGTLLAELSADAGKVITPIGAGRVFIARKDKNDEGGTRTAHEFWTLCVTPSPHLEQELIYVADYNSSFGINAYDSHDFRRFSLDRGHVVSREGDSPEMFFFNTYPPVGIDLVTRDLRFGAGHWLRNASCFEHGGTYYLFWGYSRDRRRNRAVFTVDHPDNDPRLFIDMGCYRYPGLYGTLGVGYAGSARSIAVQDDWMHVTSNLTESPPHWLAVNLVTRDVRALVVDLQRDLNVRYATLVTSPTFGLLLHDGGKATVYRVKLPPVDSWRTLDQAMADLRLPEHEKLPDPWAEWRDERAKVPGPHDESNQP